MVINNSIGNFSSNEQIKEATLNAWKMDRKRAFLPDYIIGIRYGIGVSCYKIEGVGIRKNDKRIFFTDRAADGTQLRCHPSHISHL